MAEIYELKNRIEGLGKIESMTYSMQIITISRLKSLIKRSGHVGEMLTQATSILNTICADDVAFLESILTPKLMAPQCPTIYVLFSNRGFCGNFNAELVARATEFVAQRGWDPNQVQWIGLGKKGAEVVRQSRLSMRLISQEKDVVTPDDFAKMTGGLWESVQSGRPVFAVYFQFKSILSSTVTVDPLFPISTDWVQPSPPLRPQIFLEHRDNAAGAAMQRNFLALRLYSALFQNTCAEFSKRFLIMKSAVDNVRDLSETLTLELNKERQRMITQELSELIGSFKALKVTGR